MSSSSDEVSVNGYGPSPPRADTAAAANGFTAVNGKPSSPPKALNGVNGTHDTSPRERMDMQSAAQSAPSAASAAVAAASDPPRIDGAPAPSDDANLSSTGKRKRSISEGDGREPPGDDYAPPEKRRTPQPQPPPQSQSQTQGQPQSAQQSSWEASPPQGMARASNHSMSYQPPDSESRDGQGWYGPSGQRPPSQSNNDDAALIETIRNAMPNVSPHGPPSRDYQTPIDIHGGTPQHMVSGTIETTAAGVQVDPKKRKRVFSNRTKTGCQTCRKRKKKCDEGKPECKNCQRGGFVCEGYTNKTAWPKSTHLQSRPVTTMLQPKDYGDTGGLLPRPPQNSYTEISQGPIHSDPRRSGGPTMIEEDANRNSWGGYNDTPTRPTYGQDRPSEFQHGVTLTEHNRTQHPYEERTHHVTSRGQPLAQYVESLPDELGKRNSELTAALSASRQLTGSSSGAISGPQSVAQLALQHSSSSPYAPVSSSPAIAGPGGKATSEKQKMLRGEPYQPYSSELIADRVACKAALWRFNQSDNPSVGVSREERFRFFRQILEPGPSDPRKAQGPGGSSGGRVGHDVEVEAPFNCLYGYNINLGDEVVIESNCTIMDACSVWIGNGCIIGPNVSIYTNTVTTNPRIRRGSKTPQYGRTVTIEENVFIGGNVVIKPGVKIGRGSTIGAGSVVDRDVGQYTVWANPRGDVKRGVWSDQ